MVPPNVPTNKIESEDELELKHTDETSLLKA
jgi:hypothetical protein